MKIILSSSNKDKIYEIQNILGPSYEIVLKSDIGYGDLEVIEDGETLKDNAYIKAKALYDLTKQAVIADDTGLFVDTLDMLPGVNTARYAGPHATYQDNNKKLLKDLKDISHKEARRAKFITCICYIDSEGKDYYVEGELEGYITEAPRGDKSSFGYNPIFEVAGLGLTLAELDEEDRLSINHRKRALDKLAKLMEDLYEDSGSI